MNVVHSEDGGRWRFTRNKEMDKRRGDWKQRPDQRTPAGSAQSPPLPPERRGAAPARHRHRSRCVRGFRRERRSGVNRVIAGTAGGTGEAHEQLTVRGLWPKRPPFHTLPGSAAKNQGSPRNGGTKESKLATPGESRGKLAEQQGYRFYDIASTGGHRCGATAKRLRSGPAFDRRRRGGDNVAGADILLGVKD